MPGTLYICATPIGNIEDITLRVLRVLKEADVIAAEDTRRTVQLLNFYDIKTPLTSYHEHNKETKGRQLVGRLLDGESVALVSDAGMPVISDPGEHLVKLCREMGISVTVCPGPTAGVSALALSGFPARRYAFEGFLPGNKKERTEILRSLKEESRTMVFFEAPHRLKETLNALFEALGGRRAAVVREITKKFEAVNDGRLDTLIEHFTENEPRGEFVIIVEGEDAGLAVRKKTEEWLSVSVDDHVNLYVSQGMPEKDAIKQAAKDRNLPKRAIYNEFKLK